MNLFAIPPLISSFMLLMFGVFVFSKNSRFYLARIYAYLCFVVFIWLFGYGMMYLSPTENQALFWARLGYFGVVFIPPIFYHFTIRLLNINYTRSHIAKIYMSAVPFVIFNLMGWHIKGIYTHFFWGNYPEPGITYPAFIAYFWILFLRCLILLFPYRKKSRDRLSPTEFNRQKYVFYAFVSAGFFGIFDYIPNYLFEIYPCGYLGAVSCIMIVAFAILRYQLLDIRVALTRSSIFIFIYAAVLLLSFFTASLIKPFLINSLGEKWWAGLAGIFVLFAALAPYINMFLISKAEAAILHREIRYQNILLNASGGMMRIRDLDKLTGLIVHVLTKTVRLTHAAIYLLDKSKDIFVPNVWRGEKPYAEPPKISYKHPFVRYLRQNKRILVYDEIKFQLESRKLLFSTGEAKNTLLNVEALMKQMRANVIAPNFIENKLIGFVVLGDKKNGRFYSQDDLDVFTILANEASLAIDNALFYEEVRETQARLFQSEKLATMGQLATGIAHEIHNPLTVISGEAQLLLNRLNRNFPWSKIREEIAVDRDKAVETFSKIIREVGRASDITRRILKHSRPPKTGYEYVDVNQAIEEAFALVAHQIILSDISLDKNLDENIPKTLGNLNQLQEVFINILLNAVNTLKDKKGMLKISSEFKGDVIETCFEDNGPGISSDNIKKIFNPVFTAGLDGSGLGLFLSYRIIREHGGIIDIQSKIGRGTKFIVKLPVAKVVKENTFTLY